MNVVLKIYGQSVRDTQNTERLKKKNKKKWWQKVMEREKKKNIIFFGNHSTILKSKRAVGRQGAGKKVENVYSNVGFKHFTHFAPIFWHTLF